MPACLRVAPSLWVFHTFPEGPLHEFALETCRICDESRPNNDYSTGYYNCIWTRPNDGMKIFVRLDSARKAHLTNVMTPDTIITL
jgi:hypothetical protein